MTKRALVLSGGGSKGAWQVGALKALAESEECHWDSIHGVSVGAINAAFLAMHKTTEQVVAIDRLVGIWDGIRMTGQIYKPWLPFKLNYISSMFKGSLNTGSPLRMLVENCWDHQKLLESGIKLTVGAVSLTTGKYSGIDQDNPNIFEYVLASSHLPMVFEPMTIDNEVWVDGGIRHQIPIIEALKEDPDEIDVILTSPLGAFNRTSEVKNSQLISAPKVAIRTVDILIDQIYESDCYDVIRVMNGDGRMKKIKVRLFAPSCQPSEDSMNFSEEIIQRGMAMGYEEVKKTLEK